MATEIQKLSTALANSLTFLEEQSILLEKWTQLALDEMFVTTYSGMQDRIVDFGLFIGQYITVLGEFKKSVAEKYLGNKLDLEYKGEVPNQFTNIFQVTRLWKVLGAKICEFAFILKRCIYLLTVSLPAKFFKKNTNIFAFTDPTEVSEKPGKTTIHAQLEFGILGMAAGGSFNETNMSSDSF